MLIEQTLDKLNAMKLGAMADAFQQQLQTGEAATLGFEERFGLLADAEWTAREQRKLQRRLQTAKLRRRPLDQRRRLARGCRTGSCLLRYRRSSA